MKKDTLLSLPSSFKADEDFCRKLDDWRRRQPDLPSRAEAIRRLVEIGMRAGAGTKK